MSSPRGSRSPVKATAADAQLLTLPPLVHALRLKHESFKYGWINALRDKCAGAALVAECHGFTKTLKYGDTAIGQHADVSVSSGQLQRICLARALIRLPSVFLLVHVVLAEVAYVFIFCEMKNHFSSMCDLVHMDDKT
ncbi:hypothetical protein ACHHYP_17395 [Achlya hypogyna]|uniref:ABC transporter domain-containing protein n=1 Tax=Achlya hypogyna TaxID=1202772 RepID=A0A1V9Y4K6_ACHHY|nr:hypothetical protein ACHHYP_17395 [Achlya hypogyna]